jgi:hypothetical protein
MKKIGIFTLTDALNYGAFYQMFALQQYLKERFGDEYSITVYSPEEDFKGKLIKYFSYNLKRLYRKSILRLKFNQDMSEVNIRKYRGENLDFAFFGSDEIWNVENKSFANDPNFFGLGVNATSKIAYAPSIGFAKIESFDLYPEFLKSINSLDHIFYRDNSTKALVQKAGRKDSLRVIDPTILYDKWERHLTPLKNKINQPYIAYYSYLSNPTFLKSLIKYSKEKKIPIISAGFNTHDWADQNLVLSPWEFLSFIKNADCVFTTTFHGTIMSTLLNNLVLFSPSSHKVKDFSKLLDLSKYEISEDTSVNDLDILLKSYKNKSIINKKNMLKYDSQKLVNKLIKTHK